MKFVINIYDVTGTRWIRSSFVNVPALLIVISVVYLVLCVTLSIAGSSGENELNALSIVTTLAGMCDGSLLPRGLLFPVSTDFKCLA